jgi:hypothetical protein
MAAIDLEMKWFRAKAQERGIDLAATGGKRGGGVCERLTW